MTTLDALLAALPDDLRATAPLPTPARTVSGVHISELLDPTPFLSGGELLLTTGLALTEQVTPLTAYAARLARAQITALGFGLGPVHSQVPPALKQACRRVDLSLLVVPTATPFQLVVREYWRLDQHRRHQGLTGALGSAHALVRAISHDVSNPQAARERAVRTLAEAVAGWAAYLDSSGSVLAVAPQQALVKARRARPEVERLRPAGPWGGATFDLGGDDVMLQPVGTADPGYLACGQSRPSAPHARHLVLAACAALDLHAARRSDPVLLREAAPAVLGHLLSAGHVDAAAEFARDHGTPWPPSVRVSVVVAAPELTVRASPVDPPIARHARGVATVLVHPAHRSPARTAGSGGITSPPVPISQAPAHMQRLLDAVDTVRPGVWLDESAPGAPQEGTADLRAALDRLDQSPGVDLVGTLAAYLRHRGRVEQSAHALGLHRNSLRHRMRLLTKVLGLDVDDPDVAARLWLELRARGRA